MKNIQIHKIIVKNENDPWTIPFDWRMTPGEDDAKDPKPSGIQTMTEKQFYNIVIPYRLLTINYPGYVGFERQYTSPNCVTVSYLFKIGDDVDPTLFAEQYLEHVGSNNPITKLWTETVESLSYKIVYSLNYVVEDENEEVMPL